jgi:hypothetical protein
LPIGQVEWPKRLIEATPDRTARALYGEAQAGVFD